MEVEVKVEVGVGVEVDSGGDSFFLRPHFSTQQLHLKAAST